jgi:hypothetical protein
MLRKGLIEQQIEALTLALARIIGLRSRADYESALREVSIAGRKSGGLDVDRIPTLTDESALSLVSHGGDADVAYCLRTGLLLKQHGEIRILQGREAEGRASFRKALLFLAEAIRSEDLLHPEEWAGDLESLEGALSGEPLSARHLERLYDAYEVIGDYARAEDRLFDLRDSGYPDWNVEAREFFERLGNLTDEDLERGGLSREEVEQGLGEISGA